MCNACAEELNNEPKEYINIQTGDILDLEKVSTLPDNSMLKHRPELWCEWDFEKNNEIGLDVWKVTYGSNKKAWWVCYLGHEWMAIISTRCGKKYDCPICKGKTLLVGFNDMWTTNPTQASWLANPEDGYKYMRNANQKVDWICQCCGELIKNRTINGIYKRGAICKKCTNYTKLPERLMSEILKYIDIAYIHDRSFKWSNNKRYDFYIPSLNIIIETHGGQHFMENKRSNYTTLEEEQNNDKYKYELAIQNGIKTENYIVIDCRYSDFEFIKNNIMNSRLAELFNLSNVDWDEIYMNTLNANSVRKTILDMCIAGYTKSEIINHTKYTYRSVHSIIKEFVSKGLCKEPPVVFNRKKVYQYTKKLEFVREWNGTTEIYEELGYYKSQIIGCCLGKHKTAKGYIWSYTRLHT